MPISSASDIPLLTWERGKEQSIVLGGNSVPKSWSIQLIGKDTPPLVFTKSSTNAQGYVVYSVQLPNEFPVGYYSVEVFGKGTEGGSIVAGVNITEMSVYSITQIPSDLRNLLLWLVFIVTAFSVIRCRKYAHLEYIREQNLVESDQLVADSRFPTLMYRAYKLREAGFQELKPSLFRYLIKRDGHFSHKFSPVGWTALPALGVLIGFVAGFLTNEPLPNMPEYLLAGMALMGLIDVYSGVFTIFAFSSAQIMLGHVTSVRSVLVLAIIGLAVAFSALIADFLLLASRHDFSLKSENPAMSRKIQLMIIPNGFVAGFFFFFLNRLADSLSPTVRSSNTQLIALSVGIGVLFILKHIASDQMDLRIAQKPGVVLVNEGFEIVSLITPVVVLAVAIFCTSIVYVWTESLSAALVPGLIMTLPFALLVIGFKSPNIAVLAKWPRNIYVEAGIVTAACFGVHWLIQRTPNEVIHKSEILLAIGFLPVLFHSVLGSLYDVSENSQGGGQ